MKYLLHLLLLFFLINPENNLGLKLQVGETYPQNFVSKIEMVQTINGIDQNINIEIAGGMNFKVKEPLDSGYLMTVSYSSISMKINSPMGGLVVSSEGETEDILSKVMRSMIGKEFSVKMKKNGFISDIIDIDNIYSDVFSLLPDMSELQRQQILTQVKQAYGKKAFKGNIEMITAIFPNHDVSIGDSWKNSVKLESGIPGVMNNTYTLVDSESDTVVINGISEINTDDKLAYVQTNGMPTKYNLTGKVTSSYKLDPSTNWILEGVIEQKLSGNVEIQDDPNLPGGMNIPMVISSKMLVK